MPQHTDLIPPHPPHACAAQALDRVREHVGRAGILRVAAARPAALSTQHGEPVPHRAAAAHAVEAGLAAVRAALVRRRRRRAAAALRRAERDRPARRRLLLLDASAGAALLAIVTALAVVVGAVIDRGREDDRAAVAEVGVVAAAVLDGGAEGERQLVVGDAAGAAAGGAGYAAVVLALPICTCTYSDILLAELHVAAPHGSARSCCRCACSESGVAPPGPIT